MSQVNVKPKPVPVFTHEGAKAYNPHAVQQLRRALMACMLWEDQFYESGEQIAERIASLIKQVDATAVMNLAIEARQGMKLRHAPLLVAREMARLPEHKMLVAHTLEQIIDRPDEITEFLAIYWRDKKQPISAQVKKGLAAAFQKFDAYRFAKYDREGAIKLRDVAFLVHPAAGVEDKERGKLYAQLLNKTDYPERTKSAQFPVKKTYKLKDYEPLASPDTWEVALSAGADKKETFTRLIEEKKLGALALLRNLRNMQQVGVDKALVSEALMAMNAERVLPFRFIAAARAVPQWEDIIELPMLKCLEGQDNFKGRTGLLLDVSGSMDNTISAKSELRRVDAACGLAILLRELCPDIEVATFSNKTVLVPPRRGFALRDVILQSQPHSSTYLGAALGHFNAHLKQVDRLIVITDEQSHDSVPPPPTGCKGYVINVASYQNGVGYGAWNHIDGWSEAVVDYIRAFEAAGAELEHLD